MASLITFFVPHSLGVFIYNSTQYQVPSTKAAYNAMNGFILGMVMFGLIYRKKAKIKDPHFP